MDAFVGMIATFGFNFSPVNWQTCQGQLIGIAQNQALFALIGTTYGGNGTTTFQLPDLQGRVAVGQGNGPGLSGYVMGQKSGTESTTILTTNMPTHIHTVPAGGVIKVSANPATSSTPSAATGTLAAIAPTAKGGATVFAYNNDASPAVTLVTGAGGGGGNTGPTGGSQPISTLQPYLTINYCICMNGIFPSRN